MKIPTFLQYLFRNWQCIFFGGFLEVGHFLVEILEDDHGPLYITKTHKAALILTNACLLTS